MTVGLVRNRMVRTLVGYFAAVLLPILYTEIPTLIVFRWYWWHRESSMPVKVKHTAERDGRLAPFLAVAILGLSVWSLILRTDTPLEALGIHLIGWEFALLVGIVAGAAWLALYVGLLAASRPSRDRIAQHLLLQEGPIYWISLGLFGAVIEEVWRAFCLVSTANQGPVTGLAVTAAATAWGHPHPWPRAVSTAAFSIYVGAIFLWTRSLSATVTAHVLVNFVSVWLIRAVV